MEEDSDRSPADIARYPMVPIRDVVIFPFTKVAFKIGRPGSVRALEMALASDRTIFLSTQHDATVDEPAPEQIYSVGTIARILQSQRQENGQIKVVVEGRERATTIRVENNDGAFTALVRRAPVVNEEGVRSDALVQKIAQLIEQHLRLAPDVQPDALQTAMRNADSSHMADALASQLRISVEDKQGLLELFSTQARLARLIEILEIELEKRQLDRTIQTRVKRQMEKAQKEYYLNEQIKERILEYLAVRQLVKNPKGSILCFVGPPGVGKTSLGKSIARATGRKFVRLSLGGVRDEAEIRGHRRTYIGALPGQIIQMMKKAGTVNPVFVLDEVDKMSMDFRGDPSAALMEVLDPELNHAFTDHYLDVEYDLSKVMFICTANVLHTIHQPLQDRMEILRLPGYTEIEKREIAKRFLLKKQREATGLTDENLQFSDDSLNYIIRHYTQEAGVRNLEREIANIGRKTSRRVVKEGRQIKVEVTPANVNEFLGVIKFRELWAEKKNEIGLTTGLAWTEMGGQVLTTEAGLMHGKGRLTLTGKLGDVMQESAQAAMSYVRSRTAAFGLPHDFYRHLDIHVHVPEGAIPKDGPSAGITIGTAIVSALTHIPVRCDVAMTGEITLRGKVLPIGGVKEKVLAAHRLGIRTVLLPKDNEKDLADIPPAIQ